LSAHDTLADRVADNQELHCLREQTHLRDLWRCVDGVASPRSDDNACGVKALKPMVIETLIAKPPVEAFYKGILCRLSRRNEFQLHAVAIRPLVEGTGSEIPVLQ